MKKQQHLEYNQRKHKVKNEFGYSIMWFFVVIMVIVFPLLLNMHISIINYLAGLAAFGAGIYKLYRGIKLKKTLL